MTTLREILDKRKEDARPLPHGPRKGRPWGRHQRRLFREAHEPIASGSYYGDQYHYKNAAARKLYRDGLDAIMATGVEGETLQYAIEDLTRHHCNRVTIYLGLHNKVIQELRSARRREDRKYATEHDSGDPTGTPPDSSSRSDT